MSGSSRRALLVLLFIGLALAGDRLLALVATHAVEASQFRLSRLYRGDVDADILVLGNSRGVHSIYAPRLGEATCSKAFNAAYNGLTLQMMLVVLKDYLERNRAPRHALIEISATSGWEPSSEDFRTFVPLSSRLQRIFEGVSPRYPYWSRLTHLYHFNTELFLRSLFYMRRDDQDWIIGDRQITADVKRTYEGLASTGLDRKRRRILVFAKLAETARQAGVQPIFFLAPYHPVAFERTAEMEAWLQFQREAAGDVPLLDLSRAEAADDGFADPIHLNRTGSERLIARILATREGQSLKGCRSD